MEGGGVIKYKEKYIIMFVHTELVSGRTRVSPHYFIDLLTLSPRGGLGVTNRIAFSQ